MARGSISEAARGAGVAAAIFLEESQAWLANLTATTTIGNTATVMNIAPALSRIAFGYNLVDVRLAETDWNLPPLIVE
jgi:hypothetical protein